MKSKYLALVCLLVGSLMVPNLAEAKAKKPKAKHKIHKEVKAKSKVKKSAKNEKKSSRLPASVKKQKKAKKLKHKKA